MRQWITGSSSGGPELHLPVATNLIGCDAGVDRRDGGTGCATAGTSYASAPHRYALEAFAQRAVLDAHYQAHPRARPQLAEIALATAELDGNPLAARPDLVRRAAAEIGNLKDDATPDDVLIFAAGLAATPA
jgi:hypothetical protein